MKKGFPGVFNFSLINTVMNQHFGLPQRFRGITVKGTRVHLAVKYAQQDQVARLVVVKCIEASETSHLKTEFCGKNSLENEGKIDNFDPTAGFRNKPWLMDKVVEFARDSNWQKMAAPFTLLHAVSRAKESMPTRKCTSHLVQCSTLYHFQAHFDLCNYLY